MDTLGCTPTLNRRKNSLPWGGPMSRKSLVLGCLSLVAGLWLSGCGSIHAVKIAITPSATTVDGGDSITLTAAVTNDQNRAGVTWTLSGGGTLSNTTTTSATYTAPAATSSAQTITVTATSVADTTKTGTTTITVAAKPAITTGARRRHGGDRLLGDHGGQRRHQPLYLDDHQRRFLPA